MPKRTKLDDASPYLRTLYYGDGGTGKTTNVCHAANYGDVVIFDAEGGVLLEALRDFDINTANIDIVRWEDVADFRELLRELRTDPPFAFVVDSSTEAHDLMLGEAGERRRARGERDDSDKVSLKDHGDATGWHKELIRDMRSLECHVLMTALEACNKDDETSRMECGPQAPNKMAKALVAQPDQVLRCSTVDFSLGGSDDGDDVWHVALSKRTQLHAAKDRTRTLPRVLPTPTFDRVWAYFTHDLTADTDEVLARYQTERDAFDARRTGEAA